MEILIGIAVFFIVIELLILLIYFSAEIFLPSGKLEITINKDRKIEAVPGVTLLENLYRNKIFIPSACGGRGTCGHCKIAVTKGAASRLPTEAEFLTAEEKEKGFRLACQVKVQNNLEISVPDAYLNATSYKYKTLSSELKTSDIRELKFGYVDGEKFRFKAGQYIQVKIPVENQDEIVFRAYSLASAEQNEDEFSLLVKLIPGGLGSTWLHNLKPGDMIEFTGPYGDWRYDESDDSEILLIGGGSGLAPMKSIILSVLPAHPSKRISFFYGARTPEDLIDLNDFRELSRKYENFDFIPAVNEGENWSGEKGFIHLAFTKLFKKQKPEIQVFLCGPPPMIEAVKEEIEFKEIKKSDIFYDKF